MLVEEPTEAAEMLLFLASEVSRGKWQYVEIRSPNGASLGDAQSLGFQASQTYSFHRMDLSQSLEELFARSHKSCVQRKVRRAEREGLQYEQGRSELLLNRFHHLLRMTRRRHGLPPQPWAWFRNLVACLGEKVTIHIASRKGQPIAGILTLSFKKTLVYKYGGSDAQYHNLGTMPFLFWQAIQYAKKMALEEFDLGRSDSEDTGLIDFKRHLGATDSSLVYYRFPAGGPVRPAKNWKLRTAKRVFRITPDPLLSAAGSLLYRHFG